MTALNAAFDEATVPGSPQLRTVVVGVASAASAAKTDDPREAHWILSQVVDTTTGSVRVVTV